MKKYLVSLSIGLLLLSSCTDDSPDFSGVRFTMNGDVYQIPRQDCYYYFVQDNMYPDHVTFNIVINLPLNGELRLSSVGSLKINNEYTHSSIICSLYTQSSSTIYSFDCQSEGHFRITQASESNALLAGEFSYQMITNSSPADTIRITDGIINLF